FCLLARAHCHLHSFPTRRSSDLIGTSSVKAVAADGDGAVVASARVPHGFVVPSPGRFEHDAARAWRAGPRAALAALGDLRVRGVDRKSTRLNSSHQIISYAVFCL